jgi:hypothetical protein
MNGRSYARSVRETAMNRTRSPNDSRRRLARCVAPLTRRVHCSSSTVRSTGRRCPAKRLSSRRTPAMPAASLLALIDDIAALLDDVAVLSKVAAKKTAGVMGDDLALNAQQVSGVSTDRELPVVWAVAKGSLLNKLILVPAALVISAFVPKAILPLMMIGGVFLVREDLAQVCAQQSRRRRRIACALGTLACGCRSVYRSGGA